MSNTTPGFLFATCQNVLCEVGSSEKIGEIVTSQGYKSVLFVTDPGIANLNLHESTVNALKASGVEVTIYKDVQADPPESIIFEALECAKQANAEVVIGFGGGSSMDVAKLIAFLAHPECSQSLADIYGVNNAKGQRLPLIQVPTTAGTGSEVTQVAIVTTGETTKMGSVSPIYLPDYAILDAGLTVGLPPHVTAATGVDAMVHAIESYTSAIKKNPMSDLLAKEALKLMGANIQTAVHNGKDLGARQQMLFGAMLAGQAFANSPVAAVHALAYPLGGHFHIPHGLSNSLVLPHVLRFNIPKAAAMYAELAPYTFPNVEFKGSDEEIAEQFVVEMEKLIKDLGLPMTLKEMDIEESFLPTLAKDSMLQERLLVNNPREVSYDDSLAIYTAAYQ